MGMQQVAAAMQRVQAVLRRTPAIGLHDDAPATARWEDGTRVIASHANGVRLPTDMAGEIGGSGDQVTPGWLFRAGLAACLATRIAMSAAAEGIELTALEVNSASRSDTRGLLGMTGADGAQVCAGPSDVQLRVRIAARGVAAQRLRTLVESSRRCSPIVVACESAMPVALHIDVDAH